MIGIGPALIVPSVACKPAATLSGLKFHDIFTFSGTDIERNSPWPAFYPQRRHPASVSWAI